MIQDHENETAGKQNGEELEQRKSGTKKQKEDKQEQRKRRTEIQNKEENQNIAKD